MIWESKFIMTVIDLIIIVITFILFLNFYKNRKMLRQLKIQNGIVIILSGFFIMALLYFIDILTMYVFPLFISQKMSMEIMTNLHLNYNWILSAIGFSLLFIAILYLNKVLFPKVIFYQKELEKASITDQLTGLLNRRGFYNIAQKQCEIASRRNLILYYLFIDIDGLKAINDQYGHKEGDILLQSTSSILKNTFRSSDLICRMGGDEFLVMTMEAKDATIEDMTNRLTINLNSYNTQTSKPYKLSLSTGLIQNNPGSPFSIGELISKADEVMYKQKRKNKS